MRISDWSSDVCSSDLRQGARRKKDPSVMVIAKGIGATQHLQLPGQGLIVKGHLRQIKHGMGGIDDRAIAGTATQIARQGVVYVCARRRSEEHTSELQSLMRISYAVFCLKKKNEDDKLSPRLSTQDTQNTE